MSIKQLLNKWINGAAPTWDVKNKHQIVKAFKLDGVQYYQFKDINNTMSGRAFAALDFYNELDMKCNRDYLLQHTEAVDALLSDPKKINVGELYNLNKQIKERLEFILVPDIVYKLASVVYFDESEAPYDYDYQYGGWAKNRRTRVMHRVILPRDDLRKWTWLWDPRLGAIDVQSKDVTIDYTVPARGDKTLQGLRPY